ncbi:MAG: pilin [Patescibacteria group bacterium]|nr:pilin [Patescibacteria group bacterium]
MLNKIYIKIFFIFCVFNILCSPLCATAWDIGDPIIPTACTDGAAENCGVSDIVQTALNVFQLILGVLGSLALLFCIYGGFIWILSRGNQQMIEQGKNILLGAAIGLTLVLCSWVIINFVIAALTGHSAFNNIKIFDKVWWKNKN